MLCYAMLYRFCIILKISVIPSLTYRSCKVREKERKGEKRSSSSKACKKSITEVDRGSGDHLVRGQTARSVCMGGGFSFKGGGKGGFLYMYSVEHVHEYIVVVGWDDDLIDLLIWLIGGHHSSSIPCLCLTSIHSMYDVYVCTCVARSLVGDILLFWHEVDKDSLKASGGWWWEGKFSWRTTNEGEERKLTWCDEYISTVSIRVHSRLVKWFVYYYLCWSRFRDSWSVDATVVGGQYYRSKSPPSPK